MSVEDLLHHIRKQAGDDNDDDGKPGRTAGQQLHEDKIHVLCVEERPGGCERNRAQRSQSQRERRSIDCTRNIILEFESPQ